MKSDSLLAIVAFTNPGIIVKDVPFYWYSRINPCATLKLLRLIRTYLPLKPLVIKKTPYMQNKCPQCSSSATLYFEATDLNQKITDATFNYYRCKQCNLIFINPVPINLPLYYASEYPPYKIPNSLEQLDQMAEQLDWRIDIVRKYKKNGKLLEIGPSFGAFAHKAQKSGFQVNVIEMDEHCCQFINSHTQVKAIHSNDVVSAMQIDQARYDSIVLWHNLEHLVDPWAVLEQAASQLNVNGILVVSTPNPYSIQFRLFKKYWMHLDAPRHLALVPHELLTRFLSNLELELVFTTTTDPDGLSCNTGGWYVSIMHVLSISDENSLWARIIFKILRILSGIISPLERIGLLGSTYTAIYKKNEPQ